MKTKALLLSLLLLGGRTFLCAQNILNPDVCIKTIYDFYTQRAIIDSINKCIWEQAEKDSIKNWTPISEKQYSIEDSVLGNYCTKKIRAEAKDWFFDGHDRYTNDGFFDKTALKTLSVEKYDMKINTYKVSYIFIVNYPKLEQLDNTFLVTLVEENGHYLIDEITGINEDEE
jgi:hypothetical protein